jgi:hypothetical protein
MKMKTVDISFAFFFGEPASFCFQRQNAPASRSSNSALAETKLARAPIASPKKKTHSWEKQENKKSSFIFELVLREI